MKNRLKSAIIYNLSSSAMINQHLDADLNGLRKVFERTTIVTFDYDAWCNIGNDAHFINTPDDSTIYDVVIRMLQKQFQAGALLEHSEHIVYGTSINEEFESIINDILPQINSVSTYSEILALARASEHYHEQLEWSLINVIPSHITFYCYVRMFQFTFADRTIFRIVNDSVEIPLKCLNEFTKQQFLVDSHCQTVTKWGASTKYFPLVHFASKHFCDALSSKSDEKFNLFTFGMSNYTGDEKSERSLIETTMWDVSNSKHKINFYCSGNVTGKRNKIEYSEYLTKVAQSCSTMIIPSYDKNALSLRRISESVGLNTVCLFWSTDDLLRAFDNPQYGDVLLVYEKYDIIIHSHEPEAIRQSMHNAAVHRKEIISELKSTKIWQEWHDLTWYKSQMSNIINASYEK